MVMVSVCDTCPQSEPSTLAKLLPLQYQHQEKVAGIIHANGGPENQLQTAFIFMVLEIFWTEPGLSSQTTWATHQCLDAIWQLGNRGMPCQEHHLAHIDGSAKQPLCLRKYMMEQTIAFLRDLWQESEHNEEQFQALLRDRWPVHQGAFVC